MSATIGIRTAESQPFILLPTYINGKGPFDFVLDTGASMSIITEELARIVGIEGSETKEAMGVAGKSVDVQLGKVDSISIGEIRVDDVQIGVLKELPKCVGAKGDLGYNVLKGFVLTIDYKSNLLTLSSPRDTKSQNRPVHPYVPLRLARPDRPILLVDVLVNAQETYRFILDTGASHTVVSAGLAQRMRIGGGKLDSLIGVGGVTQSSVGRLQSLSIGEASLRNVAVIIADMFSAISQAVDIQLDGILGFNFLRAFKVEIDYPNGRLRLL